MVLGAAALLGGGYQGKEYAELPRAIDLLVVVIWISHSVNVFATIARRRDKEMYVSLWYIMATMVWGAVIYIVGNKIWDPLHNGAYQGIGDAIVTSFYIHNAVGIIFTPVGLAVAYGVLLHHLPGGAAARPAHMTRRLRGSLGERPPSLCLHGISVTLFLQVGERLRTEPPLGLPEQPLFLALGMCGDIVRQPGDPCGGRPPVGQG